MKSMRILAAVAVVFAAVAVVAASEKKVQMKDVPAAVQKTVRDETKNAMLVALVREQSGDKVVYEVETKVGMRTRDVLIDATGKVTEVEEEVALDSVPAPVKAAIENAAAGGKVVRVESVTRDGTTGYEAALLKHGRRSTIEVAKDGTVKK